MHLTKPAGCAFQLFGFFVCIIGLGFLGMGGGKIVLGIILAPTGAWMFWRGRRTPERKEKKEVAAAQKYMVQEHKKRSQPVTQPVIEPTDSEPDPELPPRDKNGRFIIPES